MEKVKVPQEVADAIEYAKKVHTSLTNILDDVFNCGGSGDAEMKMLAEFFKDDEISLMSALVNGYEIKKTSDERLREYYEYLLFRKKGHASKGEYAKADARLDGFLKALELLEVKIEGVNN